MHDDSALRSLDAAAKSLTVDEKERAKATLERIVATAPTTETQRPAAPAPARRAWRAWPRLVLVSMAALVLVVVGAVVVRGIGSENVASASWTDTPTPVTGDNLDVVASACRPQVKRYFVGWGNHPADKADLVLAERRGDRVALLYHTEHPNTSATCFAHNPEGSTLVSDVQAGAGSSESVIEAPPRGFTQGFVEENRASVKAQVFSITDGAVGKEVKGVTIHAGAHTIKASVKNGWYAAWWPGRAVGGRPFQWRRNGKEPRAFKPILTYDLTLTDGTVIRDAQPVVD